MRISPECVPCILSVRMREVLNSNLPPQEKVAILKELTSYYANLVSPEATTSHLAWVTFKKVKELLRDADPYREFKRKSHEVALKLVEEVARELEKRVGFSRFHYAVKASLAANFVDPGTPLGTQPEDILEKLNTLKLGIDETEALYMRLLQSSRVTYLLDNCGEAIFDALLLREIKSMGIELKIVVKGEPYQNDVTYSEALEHGFGELGEIVSTGSDFPGIVPNFVSKEAVDAILWAELIVSKGMANYEAFLLNPPPKPTFVLLVAKCDPIARSIGVEKGEAAAFFFQAPVKT